MIPPPPISTLFPYTTLFRSETSTGVTSRVAEVRRSMDRVRHPALLMVDTISSLASMDYRHDERSEEHTSELQSRQYLVCRLLLEKKKKDKKQHNDDSVVPTR